MNVLIATDGKPHTEKTAEYAIDYAARYNAALFVLFAVCPCAVKEEAMREGKQITEAIKMKALEKRVSVTTMIEAGDPAEAIIRTSDKIGAEAIIMGASGKCEANRKRPLGSVSSIVAQNACCSVIIVR
jgi:nucleotide-binding universal stress UspA family protein